MIELDWECIEGYTDEIDAEPDWNIIDPGTWECYSCKHGPCYQYIEE